MSDQSILLHELLMLVAWLCALPLIVTLIIQIFFFHRCRIFQHGFATKAVIGLLLTIVGVMIFSIPLWIVLPQSLIPASALPDGWFPPFFLPAILASIVIGPLAVWWVVSGVHFPKNESERKNGRSMT
ncbi:MAG: hypothetical protein H6Q42_4683 [Deltaproteobacteria bacterium]|nr:hypothetical protein [Deltaproteobacteria bacterium]